MAYDNPRHRKDKETKIRLSDPVEEAVRIAANLTGMQKAAWLRKVVERELVRLGFDIDDFDSTGNTVLGEVANQALSRAQQQ